MTGNGCLRVNKAQCKRPGEEIYGKANSSELHVNKNKILAKRLMGG